MAPRYGQVDLEYAQRLATCPPDEDGPVLMVNYMRYRERAEYRDGTDGGRTGREADDEYAPVDVLADIGAVVASFGDVIDDEASTGWHRIGIVQYPTRRSFIEMQSRRDFRDKHTHKEAGMERTIVLGVPVHLVRSTAETGEGSEGGEGSAPSRADRVVFDLVRHDRGLGAPAPRHATGPVEGTIMGDGRTWTELRISWLGADDDLPPLDDVDDRERVVVRPSIDRLRALLAAAGGPQGS